MILGALESSAVSALMWGRKVFCPFGANMRRSKIVLLVVMSIATIFFTGCYSDVDLQYEEYSGWRLRGEVEIGSNPRLDESATATE
jgi:hypothetical protein